MQSLSSIPESAMTASIVCYVIAISPNPDRSTQPKQIEGLYCHFSLLGHASANHTQSTSTNHIRVKPSNSLKKILMVCCRNAFASCEYCSISSKPKPTTQLRQSLPALM